MFDVKIGRIMSVNNVSEASNCRGHIKLMLGGGHRGGQESYPQMGAASK